MSNNVLERSWDNIVNSTIGCNVTYIANAYPRPIGVYFHQEQVNLDAIVVSSNVTLELDCGHRRVEFDRLSTGNHLKQLRNTAHEYLTIYTLDSAGHKMRICGNKQIDANRSFIVTQEGDLVPQKYGGNLWVDEDGNNHKQ